jgi:hypothetical protein
MFNFYFTNKQANIKASYLKFKKLLSSPKFVAQKLLYCSGFGFFLLVAALLEVRMSGQAQVPILILILFILMALISIYVASRRFQK